MIIKRPSYLLFVLLFALAGVASAQKPSATPRQEKLLNGLKVLILNTAGADKTTLKLRIHAGAAFDPQEKEGVMMLLSESFFPTAESRSFFKDELDGGFELICNYDYIQFNATAKNSDFLTLLETVAQAVSNPDLSKEAAATLKTNLLAKIQEAEKDSAYVADRAVAKRLFGTFPYGRPSLGSTASLQKIDFADLRFAKDRLLTADNATLIISGNVDPALALRAARRYFGSWLKSDKKVPSTFRQPDAPDTAVVKVEMPGVANSEVRYAMRGFARSSKEFAAAEIYARTLQARFAEMVAKGPGSDATVAHDEHILPGAFVFRYRSQPSSPTLLPPGSETDATSFRSLLNRPVTEAEFSAAKTEVLASLEKRDSTDLWLDIDTFRITSVADELKAFQNLTLADVNSISSKLVREPLATAVVAAPAVAASNTTN
jgi:predicted Zn-dependent peptidase